MGARGRRKPRSTTVFACAGAAPNTVMHSPIAAAAAAAGASCVTAAAGADAADAAPAPFAADAPAPTGRTPAASSADTRPARGT